MRIANQTIVRNYTRNLNSNLSKLNAYSNQIVSQRKFNNFGEDTIAGVRALQVRRNMSRIDSYVGTAKTVKSNFSAAEDYMSNTNTMLQDIQVLFTQAKSENNGPDERQAIAQQVEKLRDEILSCMNGNFGGRYLFGGTNVTSAPFDYDKDNGILKYNGITVYDMSVQPPYTMDQATYDQLFKDDTAYVDIGLGLTVDASGNAVVSSTAFASTLGGLDCFGFGENNILYVCDQILAALEDPNFDGGSDHARDLLNKVQDAYKMVNLNTTQLGADYKYLDYTIDRLETQAYNLVSRQNDIEFVDSEEAILNWKMQEYVYNAALQMGQRLLQPTLFNFIS